MPLSFPAEWWEDKIFIYAIFLLNLTVVCNLSVHSMQQGRFLNIRILGPCPWVLGSVIC